MKTLIKNVRIINNGTDKLGSIIINGEYIESISDAMPIDFSGFNVIDGNGKVALPGVIDDQVHFREPGLTHKGDIYSESKAAVAGGITSYMEMPNTNPQTIGQALLEQKYELGERFSLANYSFYIGATNDNLQELLKTNPKNVCGIKVFMGSSTGHMLVDDPQTLEGIFKEVKLPIAVHCEDETTIKANIEQFTKKYGDDIPLEFHPVIRSAEACYKSTAKAVELATKYGTRLHVLHLSTAKEMELFRNGTPSKDKKITAEVCVHHLWFSEQDYKTSGTRIKWNPAVKSEADRQGLWDALNDGRIDVIATDHAPHTMQEKNNVYTKAPSGGPLVQHSLQAMLDFYKKNLITLENMVDKLCHKPAEIFNVEKRGFIKPGYYADLVLIDLDKPYEVTKKNILYKCGWSPFEGHTFGSTITHTFVNGNLVFENGRVDDRYRGMRLMFER